MTRKTRPAKPAGEPGTAPGHNPIPPKPGRKTSHQPGQPGKGGFDRSVKPLPLPGKSRGR